MQLTAKAQFSCDRRTGEPGGAGSGKVSPRDQRRETGERVLNRVNRRDTLCSLSPGLPQVGPIAGDRP